MLFRSSGGPHLVVIGQRRIDDSPRREWFAVMQPTCGADTPDGKPTPGAHEVGISSAQYQTKGLADQVGVHAVATRGDHQQRLHAGRALDAKHNGGRNLTDCNVESRRRFGGRPRCVSEAPHLGVDASGREGGAYPRNGGVLGLAHRLGGRFLECALDDGQRILEEMLGHHQWRQEAQDIAVGAGREDQDSLVMAQLGDLRRHIGVGGVGARLGDLDGNHRAATADVADDSGVLYVADADQDRVWKLTPAPDPISLLRVPDRFAPGMIAFFNGYNFTRPEVVFDNTIATILAHKDASLAVLVPATLQPGPIALDIRDDGVSIARLTGIVTSAAPQLFAAVNEDGSVNTPSNAAARGSILVLYGTGQGLLAPPVTVSIAGYAADVLYSGPVSGFAGLWQVNARVPGGFLSPGQLPLSVSVGDAVSASLNVTIK